MKVYVVEKGCYEDRHVQGIYATAELAMAANPIPDDIPQRNRIEGREPGWVQDPRYGDWDNGLDWGEAGTIWEATVVDTLASTRNQPQQEDPS